MKRFSILLCMLCAMMRFASAESGNSTSILDLVRNGEEKKVLAALDAGASIKVRNRFGETPLMLASERGNGKIVAALLKAGADVREKRKNGVTALMMAAERGHVDAAKELIRASAEVDAAAENGNTALLWAAMRGHYDVVKLLTEKGADISRKNKNGYTAAELAGKWRRGKIVQYLRELELKKIAPDNGKDKSGPVKSPRGDDEEEE